MQGCRLIRIPRLELVSAEYVFIFVLIGQQCCLNVSRIAIHDTALGERCKFAVDLDIAECKEIAFTLGYGLAHLSSTRRAIATLALAPWGRGAAFTALIASMAIAGIAGPRIERWLRR